MYCVCCSAPVFWCASRKNRNSYRAAKVAKSIVKWYSRHKSIAHISFYFLFNSAIAARLHFPVVQMTMIKFRNNAWTPSFLLANHTFAFYDSICITNVCIMTAIFRRCFVNSRPKIKTTILIQRHSLKDERKKTSKLSNRDDHIASHVQNITDFQVTLVGQ